jgi:hypothetical protein
MGGLLIGLTQERNELLHALESKEENSEERAHTFIEKWFRGAQNELSSFDFLNRPLRVCGMVENTGEPGGGPFWVKDENQNESKQIVEKAQLANTDKVNALLMQSTHFNPVMMALDFKDFNGNHYDLAQFTDEDAYFIVEKSHLGKSIRFIEQPGLWNGCMAKWNTIFIEIPNEVFTPVKTVLDLLQITHQSN